MLKILYEERYILTTMTNVDLSICKKDNKILTFLSFIKNGKKIIFKLTEKELYKLYISISKYIEGDIIYCDINKRITLMCNINPTTIFMHVIFEDILITTNINMLEALTFAEWLRTICTNIKHLMIMNYNDMT